MFEKSSVQSGVVAGTSTGRHRASAAMAPRSALSRAIATQMDWRPAARPARRMLIGVDERDEIVLFRQASDDGREREMRDSRCETE